VFNKPVSKIVVCTIMSSHHCIVDCEEPVGRHKDIPNQGAKGISYYTPAQIPSAGTASDPQPDGFRPPKLFQPLKIRLLTMQNRIMVYLSVRLGMTVG
jgi:hypothetical protein